MRVSNVGQPVCAGVSAGGISQNILQTGPIPMQQKLFKFLETSTLKLQVEYHQSDVVG